MPTTTREQAASALFSLMTTSVNKVVGLKTTLRRFRLPEDVAPAQTPALFQIQTEEPYEYRPGAMVGIPPVRTMIFDLHLYVTDASATSGGVIGTPSTQLNNMIQAIETALLPDATTNRQTLGGIVYSARIEGKIQYLESRTLDGLSIAMIPISVVFP